MSQASACNLYGDTLAEHEFDQTLGNPSARPPVRASQAVLRYFRGVAHFTIGRRDGVVQLRVEVGWGANVTDREGPAGTPGTEMSETHRMIEREEGRLARSTGTSVRLTRRALLTRTAALAAAWTVCPWSIGVPSAFGQEMDRPSMTQTLEAFADTLIPGEKRFPADQAIAGVVSGAARHRLARVALLTDHPLVHRTMPIGQGTKTLPCKKPRSEGAYFRRSTNPF